MPLGRKSEELAKWFSRSIACPGAVTGLTGDDVLYQCAPGVVRYRPACRLGRIRTEEDFDISAIDLVSRPRVSALNLFSQNVAFWALRIAHLFPPGQFLLRQRRPPRRHFL